MILLEGWLFENMIVPIVFVLKADRCTGREKASKKKPITFLCCSYMWICFCT